MPGFEDVVGAAKVVELPDTQLMTPPFSSVVPLNGSELPPVLPPVHPLMVNDVSVPEMFVQTIFENEDAEAVPPENPTKAPEIGMDTAPSSRRTRFILAPAFP